MAYSITISIWLRSNIKRIKKKKKGENNDNKCYIINFGKYWGKLSKIIHSIVKKYIQYRKCKRRIDEIEILSNENEEEEI